VDVLLWTVIALPFLAALILAIFGAFLPKKAAGVLGALPVGVSWLIAMVVAADFLSKRPDIGRDTVIYPWIALGNLQATIGLHLDALSLVMMGVVTFVSFLILVYSTQSMYDEDGYSRFFAYMNLFVGSMLALVLADNLLLLYLGWEGVGVCSYLLIGFWYRDRANVRAANKAFIVTRIGDTFMAIALFLIFTRLGSLNIQGILAVAPTIWSPGDAVVTVVALLLIGGAIGKSAQLPLHTWLPDAMAGPTPTSALIHAATMVTAGVYLIARLNVIFTLSPVAQLVVAIIGAATLLYSAFSALVQTDLKRVLAYSTMSQVGYMFLALGVGAWSLAIFHLVTHAFFKALLFLSAGIVIDALHHERDMFRMGGLKRRLPVAFWTFLIGAASLAALPLLTAGFYSKDAILWATWSSRLGGGWFWAAGVIGALLTAAYASRAILLVFYGEEKTAVSKLPGALMKLVVIVLAFFSIVAGFADMSAVSGPRLFSRLMAFVFPPFHEVEARSGHSMEIALSLVAVFVTFLGIYLAYLYIRRRHWSEAVARSSAARATHRFLLDGWDFDRLYDALFVRPFKAIACWNRADFADKLIVGLSGAVRYGSIGLSATQTGRVRNYAVGLILGAVIISMIVLFR
jgi:NADH-quinone oxidoreductase subunit L